MRERAFLFFGFKSGPIVFQVHCQFRRFRRQRFFAAILKQTMTLPMESRQLSALDAIERAFSVMDEPAEHERVGCSGFKLSPQSPVCCCCRNRAAFPASKKASISLSTFSTSPTSRCAALFGLPMASTLFVGYQRTANLNS